MKKMLATATAAILISGTVFAVQAGATSPKEDEHKIKICHATDSYDNPYTNPPVDVASILPAVEPGHDGHDSHTGPVFFPEIPKHTKWGDIIPPFDYGENGSYPGLNWTVLGQLIYSYGCSLTPPTTTTTESDDEEETTTTTVEETTTTTESEETTTTTVDDTTTTSVTVEQQTTTTTVDDTTTTTEEDVTTTTAGDTTTTAVGSSSKQQAPVVGPVYIVATPLYTG